MYSRILVPLDGSKLAEKALAHAEGLAKSSGATVHLIMSMTRHDVGETAIGGGLDSDLSVPHTAELIRQLEEFLKFHPDSKRVPELTEWLERTRNSTENALLEAARR